MKKKTIYIIILITSLSLAGIMFTQFFWIQKSYYLRQEQFNNKVKVALKSSVNQLIEYNRGNQDTVKMCNSFCHLSKVNIHQVINPSLLDSVIHDEFKYYQIEDYFEYGIFCSKSDSMIMGNYEKYKSEIMTSPHITSLTCLWQKDCYYLGVFFPDSKMELFKEMGIWFIGSIVFIIVSITSFSITILSLLRQKKIGEMKNDFINNMTHEFKTPISTISLTSEILMNSSIAENADKVQRYAKVIYEENNRLKSQVDKVLQTATLEKDSYHLTKTSFDVHPVIRDLIKNCPAQFKDCNVEFSINFGAKQSEIYADIVHFENIISSLIDNAIKYSIKNPKIEISTENKNNLLFIEIKDNGIGISKENINNIFKQFYRVPTGNIHDVKGFGIGLYYVKRIVDLHNATIEVKSELNKGSIFKITFEQ
ncbi:MAG: HAMP domain-containing sensor histidine kinase [Bacteroidota bacterium]